MLRTLAAVFFGCLLFLYAGNLLLSSPWLQERVEKRVRGLVHELLGMTVVWGAFDIHPLSLEVTVHGLKAYSGDGVRGTPFLQAPHVTAGVSLLGLFKKNVEIDIDVSRPNIVFANTEGEWINFLNIDKIDELIGSASSSRSPLTGWKVVVGRVALLGADIDFVLTDIDLRARLTGVVAEGRFDEISQHDRIPIRVRRAAGLYRMFGRDFQVADVKGELAVEIIDGPWVDLVLHDILLQGVYPHSSLHVKGRVIDLTRRHLFDVEAQAETDINFLNDVFFDTPQLTGTALINATYNGDFETFTVQGEVRSEAFMAEGIRFAEAAALVKVTESKLIIERATASFWGGEAAMSGTLGFEQLDWASNLSLANVQLGRAQLLIPEMPVLDGRFSGKIDASGFLDDPRKFRAELEVAAPETRIAWGANDDKAIYVPSGQLQLTLASDPEVISISAGGLHTSRESIQFAGSIGWADARTRLDVAVQTGDISILNPIVDFPISGWGMADGTWSGTLGDPEFDFNVDMRDLKLPWVHLEAAKGRLGLTLHELHLSAVEGHAGEGWAELDEGYIGPFDKDTHVRLPVRAVKAPLGKVLTPLLGDIIPLDGEFTGDFLLDSPVTRPTGYAEGDVHNARIYGERVAWIRGRMDIEGGDLRFPHLEGAQAGARLNAAGHVDPGGAIDFLVWGEHLVLDKLDHFQGYGLAGTADARLRIVGASGAPIRMTGRGQAYGVVLQNVHFGDTLVVFESEGDEMIVAADSVVASVELGFQTTPGYPGELQIQARDLVLTQALQEHLHGDVELVLSADVNLRGSLVDWDRAEGSIDIPTLRFRHNRAAISSDEPLRMRLRDGWVHIPQTRLSGDRTQGTVAGRVGVDGRLSLTLDAGIDVGLFTAFIPQLRAADGQLQANGTVQGTLGEPRVQAALRSKGARLHLRNADLLFEDVALSAAFNQNQILIDRLQATVGGGSVSGGGLLSMDGLVPTYVSLFATLGEAEARIPDWLLTRVNGRVELTGPIDNVLLSGDLEVVRSLYDEQLNWESLILRLRKPSMPVAAFGKEGLHLDLNIHAPGSILIRNNLADAKLKGDMRITGYPPNVGIMGNLQFVEGSIIFRENNFQVLNGQINFVDPAAIRPFIDLQAKTRVQEVSAGPYTGRYDDITLIATGPHDDLRIELKSEPPLSREDILSLLYMRRRTTEGLGGGSTPAAEAVNLAFKLNEELAGFQSEIQDYFGFEQLVLEPAFTEAGGSGTMKLRATKTLRKDMTAMLSTSLTSSDLEVRLGYSLTDNVYFDLGWNTVPEQQVRTESGRFGNFRVRPRLHFEFQ